MEIEDRIKSVKSGVPKLSKPRLKVSSDKSDAEKKKLAEIENCKGRLNNALAKVEAAVVLAEALKKELKKLTGE